MKILWMVLVMLVGSQLVCSGTPRTIRSSGDKIQRMGTSVSTAKVKIVNTNSTPWPSDAIVFNGHHFYCFTNREDQMTWAEAKVACRQRGGHLAMLDDDGPQGLMRSGKLELWRGWVGYSQYFKKKGFSDTDSLTGTFSEARRVGNVHDVKRDGRPMFTGRVSVESRIVMMNDYLQMFPGSVFCGYICEWDK